MYEESKISFFEEVDLENVNINGSGYWHTSADVYTSSHVVGVVNIAGVGNVIAVTEGVGYSNLAGATNVIAVAEGLWVVA